jgi:predicted transposase YbfD/YdcC
MVAALGFPGDRTPCQSTLQLLFRQLDSQALAAVLTAWVGERIPVTDQDPAGVAIDGKAQRRRLRFAPDGCPVHALSALCHEQGIVLAHEPARVGADQAETELTVAPALLQRIDWRGRVLTGDALFCQRALCAQVREAGGDYLLLVKENQAQLYDNIALLFDTPPALPAAALTDRRVARTWDHGHGRRMERRELVASTDLTYYLDWPGAAQVFRVERTWQEHGQPRRTRRYGITSLTPDQADAARLLTLRRGHWSVENRLHRHKDVNFGEDASLIHVGQGPTVMALLRDAALNLLHQAGFRRIASHLRTYSQQPAHAVALVGSLPLGA